VLPLPLLCPLAQTIFHPFILAPSLSSAYDTYHTTKQRDGQTRTAMARTYH